MRKNVTVLGRTATPTIVFVLNQFVQEKAGKNRKQHDRKGAIQLFIDHMNGYGHQWLSEEEKETFDRYFELEGKSHKDFCEIFGVDKILENISEFVGYYLIRKVMLSAEEMSIAASTITELVQWLADKGLVSEAEATDAFDRSAKAAKDLPRAEVANRLIWELAQKGPTRVEESIESGYMTIAKIEGDSVWLNTDYGETIGPVVLPRKAAALLEINWIVCCALLKSGGRWYFAEVGNIYPK